MKKVERNEALPYYLTKENISKLIEAVKIKSGNEAAIKTCFGSGKYRETKKTLYNFGIISQEMTFTDIGRTIAYETNSEIVEDMWFKIIMQYKPYEEYLQSFLINNKNDQDTVDIDIIKNFWGKCNYGINDTNRSDAAISFAAFLELAGVGKFILKRGKSPSQIQFDVQKLKNGCLDNNSSTHTKDNDDNITIETNDNSTKPNEDKFECEEREKIHVNTKNSSTPCMTNININIDCSNCSDERLVKIFQLLKGVNNG